MVHINTRAHLPHRQSFCLARKTFIESAIKESSNPTEKKKNAQEIH